MTIPVYPETKDALKGRKGLIVGIANEHSIAYGCARNVSLTPDNAPATIDPMVAGVRTTGLAPTSHVRSALPGDQLA